MSIQSDTIDACRIEFCKRKLSSRGMGLSDMRAKMAIVRRIERIEAGSLGDAKPLGGALSELRIDIGPGYRLYFTMRKRVVVILLCGGDKRTQRADIQRARKMAEEVQP